jgi:uncharacterized protein YgfB (UPF0149 family)
VQRRRLAEQWNQFSTLVGLDKASDVQRTEMRRAFYAGAAALLDAMLKGLTPGGEAEPADLEMMNDFQSEIVAFGEGLRRGVN